MILDSLFEESDDYAAILAKLEERIVKVEAARDQLLEQVFARIRPLERSYGLVLMFFANARTPDGRRPPELCVFNADPKALADDWQSSTTVEAVERFTKIRNDSFHFRGAIHNLAIPGYVSWSVGERFEEIANQWGMLLIGDTDDERSFEQIERHFWSSGKYEFMKRPKNKAASDVFLAGYLQTRAAHWFEKNVDKGDDLFVPPSLVFAGALIYADDSQGSQGPVGSRFGLVVGGTKVGFELETGQLEHLMLERHLICAARDAPGGDLRFQGIRTHGDDEYGILKFFVAYRILRYLERRCKHYLLQIAGQVMTADFMDEQVDKPIRRVLDQMVEEEVLIEYDLQIDRNDWRRRGFGGIAIEAVPAGSNEMFVLKIDVPGFRREDGPGV